MTRIKAFKTQKVLSKFMVVFGILLLLVGIFAVIKIFMSVSDSETSSYSWMPFLQGFQGLLFLVLGSYNLRNEKYFIEWDDYKLRFLLPDTKELETIVFSEVKSVNIKLFEIELELDNRKIVLDLNSLDYKDLKKIKAKFESFLKAS